MFTDQAHSMISIAKSEHMEGPNLVITIKTYAITLNVNVLDQI